MKLLKTPEVYDFLTKPTGRIVDYEPTIKRILCCFFAVLTFVALLVMMGGGEHSAEAAQFFFLSWLFISCPPFWWFIASLVTFSVNIGTVGIRVVNSAIKSIEDHTED